jgi:hypothetical protein
VKQVLKVNKLHQDYPNTSSPNKIFVIATLIHSKSCDMRTIEPVLIYSRLRKSVAILKYQSPMTKLSFHHAMRMSSVRPSIFAAISEKK